MDFLLFENNIQPEVKEFAEIKSFLLLQWHFFGFWHREHFFATSHGLKDYFFFAPFLRAEKISC